MSSACALRVTSDTHLPTSEGWTAELTVGSWLVVQTTGLEPTTAFEPTTGFEHTRVDLKKSETLRLNHSATNNCHRLSIYAGVELCN